MGRRRRFVRLVAVVLYALAHAETMFVTGRESYPVERTLLTSGLVQACLQSLAGDGERRTTSHLDVRYEPARESTFSRA